MKKNTEEKIYREAYRLFISRPYELVTISELEKAIGMTRGAIFYYVKDKEHLFREVMERYYLKMQNLYGKVGDDVLKKDIGLLQFIDIFIASHEETIRQLYELAAGTDENILDKRLIANWDRFYISLLLNAGYYLDTFHEKMDDLLGTYKNTWSFFIRKAIEKGEVMPDTDAKLFGEIFTDIYLGKALNDSLSDGMNTKELKQLFIALYNKIKV
jgi:AcrR family transcriptional regulator